MYRNIPQPRMKLSEAWRHIKQLCCCCLPRFCPDFIERRYASYNIYTNSRRHTYRGFAVEDETYRPAVNRPPPRRPPRNHRRNKVAPVFKPCYKSIREKNNNTSSANDHAERNNAKDDIAKPIPLPPSIKERTNMKVLRIVENIGANPAIIKSLEDLISEGEFNEYCGSKDIVKDCLIMNAIHKRLSNVDIERLSLSPEPFHVLFKGKSATEKWVTSLPVAFEEPKPTNAFIETKDNIAFTLQLAAFTLAPKLEQYKNKGLHVKLKSIGMNPEFFRTVGIECKQERIKIDLTNCQSEISDDSILETIINSKLETVEIKNLRVSPEPEHSIYHSSNDIFDWLDRSSGAKKFNLLNDVIEYKFDDCDATNFEFASKDHAKIDDVTITSADNYKLPKYIQKKTHPKRVTGFQQYKILPTVRTKGFREPESKEDWTSIDFAEKAKEILKQTIADGIEHKILFERLNTSTHNAKKALKELNFSHHEELKELIISNEKKLPTGSNSSETVIYQIDCETKRSAIVSKKFKNLERMKETVSSDRNAKKVPTGPAKSRRRRRDEHKRSADYARPPCFISYLQEGAKNSVVKPSVKPLKTMRSDTFSDTFSAKTRVSSGMNFKMSACSAFHKPLEDTKSECYDSKQNTCTKSRSPMPMLPVNRSPINRNPCAAYAEHSHVNWTASSSVDKPRKKDGKYQGYFVDKRQVQTEQKVKRSPSIEFLIQDIKRNISKRGFYTNRKEDELLTSISNKKLSAKPTTASSQKASHTTYNRKDECSNPLTDDESTYKFGESHEYLLTSILQELKEINSLLNIQSSKDGFRRQLF